MRRLPVAITLCTLLAMLWLGSAQAQAPYRDAPEGPTTSETLRVPDVNTGRYGYSGILDPSRIQMSHSVGMGYMSSGGHGYTQGYYMNTLSYRFNAPVLLQLRTGVTNNPYATTGAMTQPGQSAMSSFFNNAELFGGADLIWKPRDNMRIQISVNRNAPGMYGYGSPYGYGYGYGFDSMFSRYDDPFFGPDIRNR
ncbi:hypothetical protein KQI52_01935 [bacterium]|nr:hypothetical protein [bacterium]